jgi:hypothetical protein
MRRIYTNLFVGGDIDCNADTIDPSISIVHACKTCHQKALYYSGSLPSSHPNYLIYEQGSNLYLNMVDMPNELLSKFTNPIFIHAMDFINREIKTKNVLVHCNFGMSRSPSLGLVYLASTGVISNNSLEKAADEFFCLYPKYSPGTGIMLYMKRNWDFLMNGALAKLQFCKRLE